MEGDRPYTFILSCTDCDKVGFKVWVDTSFTGGVYSYTLTSSVAIPANYGIFFLTISIMDSKTMYTESAGTTYIVSCSAATAEIFDQNLMLLGKFTPD